MSNELKECIKLTRNNVFNTIARKVRGDLVVRYDGETFEVTIVTHNYGYISQVKIPITEFIAGFKSSESVGLEILKNYKDFVLKDFFK